uniref:MYND-type domain-containing protein n=1 Tax=Gasterosteus aculeatus aculeatus TaxID=481459 RepID=G3NTB8_GASAC|nr:ankyrin repeat and MYND domain-containing protein 1 [Gasterosteus aculeatus aculeatus]
MQSTYKRVSGQRGTESGEGRRQGLGVQQWPDGSRYEGGFTNGLKHGRGRYTWKSGEFYDGFFYKDYRHGEGVYSWPQGHKFTGKYYLNRKEGYGHQEFSDGATFQGLYHVEQRFGPGVFSYPDGRKDVGLWLGERLLRFCSSVEESFSLKNFPEYAAYVDLAAITHSLTQPPTGVLQPEEREDSEVEMDINVLSDDLILPFGIERYSTDGEHLPLPPGRRKELDQHFYGDLWEPDAYARGFERDPIAILPLQPRMLANMHKHRLQAGNVGWNVAAVLAMNRDGFGPKGPLEVSSELFIQYASRGEWKAVSRILRTSSVHRDVADSQGHTALIAATVNCHNHVIHLLLDMGSDIDKLNCEGMSALAVCHVLYYPFHSLYITSTEIPSNTQDLTSPAACESSPQISQVDFITDTPRTEEKLTEHILVDGLGEENVEVREEVEEDAERREWNDHGEDIKEREERESEGVPGVQRFIQVMDGHVALGSVPWKECRAEAAERVQATDKELNPKTSFDSACCVRSYNIEVTEKMMQLSAEALSRTGFPQRADSQETVRKMAAMKIEHRARLNTLKLLLDRGADPNASRVPMPVLFLAIMAADTEAVRRLLLCEARTDTPLPRERRGLYPLHVAAALPGPAGPTITELLLHAAADPDARACDQNEICERDTTCTKDKESLSHKENPVLKEGGRTALHMACQRDSEYQNASKVVALLLSHRASTDLLWSGHSPLSLAIASGNDLAVEELLNGGADPNIPLGRRVGSALCAISNFSYHLCGNRAKLFGMLIKAGADILMPVTVGDVVGTAVDYAHYSFNQDSRIANTPFHALKPRERETFKERRQLLSTMGDLLRHVAGQREREHLEREQCHSLNGTSTNESPSPTTDEQRKPVLKFCYECGRSLFVKMTACSRCHKVFYCSKTCKTKAWDERHKEECIRVTASPDGIHKRAVLKSMRGPRPLSVNSAAKTLQEKALERQIGHHENYSCN